MKNLKNKNKAIGLGLILGLTLSSGYINATDTTTTPETVANSQPNPSKVKSKPTKHTFTLSASYGELKYKFSNSYKDEILRGLTPEGYLSKNDNYNTNKLSYRNPISTKDTANQVGFNVGYLYAYNNFLHIGLSFNKANAVKLANAVDVSGSTYLGLVTKANVNINKVNLYVYQELGYQNSSVTINTPKLATNFATKIAVSGNNYSYTGVNPSIAVDRDNYKFSPTATTLIEENYDISNPDSLKQLCIDTSVSYIHNNGKLGNLANQELYDKVESTRNTPSYGKDFFGQGELRGCGDITIKNGNTRLSLSDNKSQVIMVDEAGKLYLTDANLYGINKKFNTSGFIYKIGFGGEYMVTKNLGVFVDLAYTYNIKQKEEVNIGKLENSSIASLGVSIKL